jgi:hypothetical protein
VRDERLVRLNEGDSDQAERWIARAFGAEEELVAKICAEYRALLGPSWVLAVAGE